VQGIDTERLAKAVCGLADGSITATVTGQSDREIKGSVVNGDGKQYEVVLTPERAFCDCPDSTFRHAICKHAVALALQVLRSPAVEIEERQPDLRLWRMRTSDETIRDRVRFMAALPYEELPY
jgi:uncharacterized Zn finger protein